MGVIFSLYPQAAVTALEDFETPSAEQALLHAAFFDPSISIRRRAIHGFRTRARQLNEESVPCPSSAPFTPAEAMRRKHRRESADFIRRNNLLDRPLALHELHAPDRPLSALALWKNDMINGIYFLKIENLVVFVIISAWTVVPCCTNMILSFYRVQARPSWKQHG